MTGNRGVWRSNIYVYVLGLGAERKGRGGQPERKKAAEKNKQECNSMVHLDLQETQKAGLFLKAKGSLVSEQYPAWCGQSKMSAPI